MYCHTFFRNFVYAGIFLLSSLAISAQVTLIIDELPPNTDLSDSIYVSGDFEGWTGGQETYRMTVHKGKHCITLPKTKESISFKLTRGSWESVEVAKDDRQIDNRHIEFYEKMDTLRIKIGNWADYVPKISTANEQVHLLSEDFDMSPLEKKRRVWIYLPKNYKMSSKNYPVIYMHDGQNLFDQSLSYNGEWEVDETLDQLFEEIGLELIVVGIEHGGTERIDEYAPWEVIGYTSSQQGELYIRFIKENLKPFVDSNYRTDSGQSQTGIMGSSLGGLMSFYAALKYPDTFGKAGVFSPSFESVRISDIFIEQHSKIQDVKMYFLAGNQESEQMVDLMHNAIELMTNSGFPKKNIKSEVIKGGEHNEMLWRTGFKEAVTWMFANQI